MNIYRASEPCWIGFQPGREAWVVFGDPLPAPHPRALSWPSPDAHFDWVARMRFRPIAARAFLDVFLYQPFDPTKKAH